MHRFPNPGSALDSLVNCFIFLYQNIDHEEIFDLHDMQELLVSNGLISSSGAMGVEALLRGASTDLSRDRSYNQCKMYAELYRVLGWIQSGDKALWYNFTLLGDHIATATVERVSLIESCFIGVESPNDVIDVKGDYIIRPFATILKTMNQLNGVLSRDEMILGPLSISDDTDEKIFSSMCEELAELRSAPAKFDKVLASRLKARGITEVTAGNYTRFPLGAIKALDWAQPQRDKSNYRRPQQTYAITSEGQSKVELIKKSIDIRLHNLPDDEKVISDLAFYTFYKMLEDSGFDTSSLSERLGTAETSVKSKFKTTDIIFSPFQTLSRAKLANIFDVTLPSKKRKSIYSPELLEDSNNNETLHIELDTTVLSNDHEVNQENDFYESVVQMFDIHGNDEIVEILKESYRAYTKDQYYPLIGEIFTSIGLRCDIPPHGVNSRRWDAIILSSDDSIPIEIKSPTEELHLSVKAIRQALENKIILQSRQAEKNKRPTATLAIGFELPKERADVAKLIEDIKYIYDIDIGVMGIDYLLEMAVFCIRENRKVEFSELASKQGIING